MKRYVMIFAATFLTVGISVYVASSIVSRKVGGTGHGNETHRAMVREARLIEHFCLSPIPPSAGRPSVPGEWETALGTTIRLRDNVGEIVAMAPELGKQIDAIRTLQPGQSVFMNKSVVNGDARHVLVYQPTVGGKAQLVLLKPVGFLSEESGGSCRSRIGLALLIGLAGGMILTGLGVVFCRSR